MDDKAAEDYARAILNEKSEVFVDTEDSHYDYENSLYPVIDLKSALAIKKGDYFSTSNPYHSEIAKELIETLMGLEGKEKFLEASIYCKRALNEHLFSYCFSVALLHRSDTRDIPFPSPAHTRPFHFIKSARTGSMTIRLGETMEVINIPLDLSLKCSESALAYFREDVGLNVFYDMWNLLHPSNGPDSVVKKDRRGELFYFLHRQILSRYNIERICNKIAPLPHNCKVINKTLETSYFPKLKTCATDLGVPGRSADIKPLELFRPQERLSICYHDLIMMSDSIIEAIQTRYVVDTNWHTYELDEKTGIDLIGHIVEATSESKNLNTYGNLFNLLKMFFAFAHDPVAENQEPPGAMAHSSMALRDPLMYEVISFVVNICERHKNRLTPYDRALHLDFSGVRVDSVAVQTEGSTRTNTFVTYFPTSEPRAYRLNPDSSPVQVKYQHLKHRDFTITLQVNNSGSERVGTLRIFMLPAQDVVGFSYNFFSMRRYAIQIDLAKVTLRPGKNTITRHSRSSALTMDMDKVMQDTEGLAGEKGMCGWPSYLLIPRGSADGYPVHLFAMISNDELDTPEGNDNVPILCNRKGPYPDKRPMGFPLDRPPAGTVTTLQSFLTPNMGAVQCTIYNVQDAKKGDNQV